MSKDYLEALEEIIDKFAEQMIRANKEELTAINKTNAIEYLYRTPQVRLLQQALIKAHEQEKVLKIIFEKRVDIVYLEDSNTVEEYNSHFGCVVCKLTEEEFDLLKRYCYD